MERLRAEMSRPQADMDCDAITLSSPDGRSVEYGAISHWIDCRHEVREASIVDPVKAFEIYERAGWSRCSLPRMST